MDALGDFFPITADGSPTWTLTQNRSLRNEIRFFKETPSFWLVLVVLCQARMIPSHRKWNDRLGDLWIRKWSFVCRIEKAWFQQWIDDLSASFCSFFTFHSVWIHLYSLPLTFSLGESICTPTDFLLLFCGVVCCWCNTRDRGWQSPFKCPFQVKICKLLIVRLLLL